MRAAPDASESLRTKRVAAACQFCRRSKLRCSGTQPCDRCQKRGKPCSFDDPAAVPSSPQTSGHASQHQALRLLSHDSSRFSHTVRSTTGVTAEPSNYQKNRQGPRQRRRWLYLGASSTWSFNLRVVSMLRPSTVSSDDEPMFHLDRDAYDVSWKRQGLYETPNISRLPSRDYAIYLVNTVKYHLGVFKLFDEDSFIQTLHDFYSGTVEDLEDYRLWYCKLLLVLAFGKGVLNQKKAPREPPGADYFVRAMANLPEMYALHEEPVLAMEVLTLISLYFYCMDMRQTAYSYIGQALRLALVEGNHTNLNGSQLEPQLAQRCTNNWWIMYILDRTLSSALGTPVSVHDDAIKNVLPEDSSLVLNVKLSRMVSLILSELYNADGSLDDQYLSKVRSLLRQLAKLAEEIGETISIKFPSSMETVPKSAAHVRLMYHQCIILVTRPIMLVLLQKRMRDQGEQVDELPAPVHDLLQTCAQSAIKTLKILTSLGEHNMLDSFLPFDMDFASTAASALVVIKEIMDFDVPMTAKPLIDRILGEMIASGNNAAQLRQQEIDRLHELASNFRQGRPPVRPSVPDVSTHSAALMDVGPSSSNLSIQTPRSAQQHLPSPSQTVESNTFHDIQPTAFSITPSTDFEHNFALAQDDMLLIADRLDTDAFPGAMDTDIYSGDWLAPTMQFPPL